MSQSRLITSLSPATPLGLTITGKNPRVKKRMASDLAKATLGDSLDVGRFCFLSGSWHHIYMIHRLTYCK